MFDREHDDEFLEDVNGLVERYEKMLRNNEHRFFEETSLEQLIDYYEDNNNLKRALQVAEIAIEQHPYSSAFLVKKAQLLFDLKQFSIALELLDKAAILDPQDINIFLLKADIFMWLNDFKKAISTIHEFMRKADKEDIPDLYLELADIYEEWGKYWEVFDCLKQTLEIDRKNEEALNRMWFCVEFTGKYEDSIELHNKIIDEDPYSYIAWFNLAHAYSGLGLFEKAIEAFEFALAINEDYEYAYKDAADIYFRLKQYEKAAEYYLKVASIAKPYKELFYCTGESYEKLKDLNKARYYYRKALMLDPYFDAALYKIGLSYQAENKNENAVASFEKAHKLNPKSTDYVIALAKSYRISGKIEKAAALFRKAIAERNAKKSTWIEAALTFFEALEYREAFETLDDAAVIYEKNAEFYFIKAALYYQVGNRNEAFLNLETGLIKDWKRFKAIFNITPYMKQDATVLHLIEQYKKK
jgi:tetratricopeptide (TPR) repeat protein